MTITLGLLLAGGINFSVPDLARELDRLWGLRLAGVGGTCLMVFDVKRETLTPHRRTTVKPYHGGPGRYASIHTFRLGGERWPIRRTRILDLFARNKVKLLYLFWNGRHVKPRPRGRTK